MQIGIDISIRGSGSQGSGVAAPTAPVLSVVEPVTDPPSFTAVIDDTVGSGDSYWLQVQADGGDWSTLLVDDTDTITSGEDAANEIDATVSALGAGNYDARMAVRDGSGPWSDWSNVVDVVIEESVTPVALGTVAHAEDTGDLNSYTFAGLAFGTEAADRIIAVAFGHRNAQTITSVTIGGVSATVRESSVGGTSAAYIYTAAVPTGTTGNVVVALGGYAARMGIAVFPLYGAGSEAPSDTDSSTSEPASVTLTVPANGAAVGYVFSAFGTSYGWTGLTETFDSLVETNIYHSAATLESEAGGNIAITADAGATPTDQVSVFAAWGPA